MSFVRTLPALVAGAVLLGQPSPAHAQTRSVSDPAGDVALVHGAERHEAPHRVVDDIRRFRVTYDAAEIAGTVTYRSLRLEDHRLDLAIGFEWAPHEAAALVVHVSRSHPRGVGRFGFPEDHCAAQWVIDRAHRRFTFSVPTSCLYGQDPATVSAFTQSIARAPGGGVWYDQAPRDHGLRVVQG